MVTRINGVPAQGRGMGPQKLGRREMMIKGAAAIFGAPLAAGIFGGCDRNIAGPRERGRRALRKKNRETVRGTLLSPAKGLEKYAISINGGKTGRQMSLGSYIAQVSDGRPALIVFATHYHAADEPLCNTPLAVAQKIHLERPGIAVVGVLANLVSGGTLENVAGEMGLTYPVAAMARETYYDMGREVFPETMHASAIIAGTDQKAVFWSGEHENAEGMLETEFLRVIKLVLEEKLPRPETTEGAGRGGRGSKK
jgi:hypothetical protein